MTERYFPEKNLFFLAFWIVAWLVALYLPTAAAKTKQSDMGPPLTFVVVRSNIPGCEPMCAEWISAEGTITADAPARFEKLLKKLGERKLPVVITSPGGDVDAALRLGRIIRRNGLDVAVGKTWFAGCKPDQKNCHDNDGRGAKFVGAALEAEAYCASACPLILAAGTRRLAGLGTLVGVHQVTTVWHQVRLKYRVRYRIVNGKKIVEKKIVSRKDAGTRTSYEMNTALEKRLATYLEEMSVGSGLLATIKNTPAKSIHYLVQPNMLAMKLLTGPESVAVLTSDTLCRQKPIPSNCREFVPAEKPGQPAVAKAGPESGPIDVSSATWLSSEEMSFALARQSDGKCGAHCPMWISAEGPITRHTAGRLSAFLATMGKQRLPIVVNSTSGDVLASMEVGRLIRSRALDVVIAHTRFVGCDPRATGCEPHGGVYPAKIESGQCELVCPLLLAGGNHRFVGSQSELGIQQLAFAEKIDLYLREMDVDSALGAAMQEAPYSEHRRLDVAEMTRMRLVTGSDVAEVLTH